MARRGEAQFRFVGDSTSGRRASKEMEQALAGVDRQAKLAARDLSHSNGELGRATRGAIAGSGAYRSLGRSIAFASGTFLGAAGLSALIRKSISEASDLTEQINKADVVFRASGKEVVAWSKTSATAMGISRAEAVKYAATFGNLLVPMGFARKEAAGLSTDLVQLASDMASFNNASPEDVLRALQAGLVGQVRPLRQYGVFLDQARIKAEAFSSGIAKVTVESTKVADAQAKVAIAQARLDAAQSKYGAGTTQVAAATLALHSAQRALGKSLEGNMPPLTAQQKAMATYRIIVKDTADAQGDFARTSDGLANQQRILRAQMADLEGELGTALMPTVLSIVHAMTEWLGSTENQERLHRDFEEGVKTLTSVLSIAWDVIRAGKVGFDALAGAVGGTENAIKLLMALKIATWLHGLAVQAVAAEAAVIGAGGKPGLRGGLQSISRTWVAKVSVVLLGAAAIYEFANFMEKHFPGAHGPLTKEYIATLPDWARQAILGQMSPAQRDALGRTVAPAAIGPASLRGGAPPIGSGGIRGSAGRPSSKTDMGQGIGAVSAPLDRPGASTAPIVIAMARRIAYIYGAPLTLGAGTSHREYVSGTNNTVVSDHWAGHAVDIPMSGANLVRLGQSALIAAGADPAWAAKQGGGAYNVAGWQIIFSVVLARGGDHTDHLHLGWKGGAVPGLGGGATKSVTPETPAASTGGGGGGGGTGALTVGKTPKKAAASDITKVPGPLALRISRAEGTRDLRDDVAAYQDLVAFYLGRLKRKGLSSQEKADLQDAINTAREKIRNANKQIREAAAKELERSRRDDERLLARGATRPIFYFSARAAKIEIDKNAKALAALVRQAAKDEGAGKSVVETLLGYDQSTAVQLRDQFGQLITTTIGEVVAKAERLLANLDAAIRSHDAKRIAAAEAAWKAYVDTIGNAVQAGEDAAKARLEAAQQTFQTAFGRLASRILAAFDRETQRGIDGMQRDTQIQIDALAADAERQIGRLQARLQSQLDRLEVFRRQLTPEEEALRGFDAQRAAEQRAAERAAAALIEDPAERAARIRELDLADQRAALQEAADASRKARDEEIDRQEEALRKREQAEEDSLRKRLDAETKALQEAEAARERDYQDQRDAQRTALADQLDDWQKHLQDGTAAWSDFVLWLQGLGASGAISGADIPNPVAAMAAAGQRQGSAFADAYVAELKRAFEAQQALARGEDPAAAAAAVKVPNPWTSDKRGGFAAGGIVPGVDLGYDSQWIRARPGEVILAHAQQERVASGLLGGGSRTLVVQFPGLVALGRDSDVGERLARVAEPALRRLLTMRQP